MTTPPNGIVVYDYKCIPIAMLLTSAATAAEALEFDFWKQKQESKLEVLRDAGTLLWEV
jgi:hypothetical protein